MTQSFAAWLHDQRDRDDEVGELAKEVATAGDFPDSGGKPIYDGYFEPLPEDERERYERAWMEFDAHPEPSTTSERPDGFR